MPGGRCRAAVGATARGTRLYSFAVQGSSGRRVTDATNGFRLFRPRSWTTPRSTWTRRGSTGTTLSRRSSTSHPRGYRVVRSRAQCAITGRVLHQDARHPGLVAAVPARRALRTGVKRWRQGTRWSDTFGARRILVTRGAGFVGSAGGPRARRCRRARDRAQRPFHWQGRCGCPICVVPRGSRAPSAPTPISSRELVADHSLILRLAARNIITSSGRPARRLRPGTSAARSTCSWRPGPRRSIT